jgi:hypothetical protein
MPAPIVGAAAAIAAKAVAKKVSAEAAKKATKAVAKNVVKKPKKKTPSESDISYALRHGKITKEEAAALDPKKFKILLDNSKTKTVFTVNLKTGKTTKGKK